MKGLMKEEGMMSRDDPPKRNFCYYIKFSCLWKSDDPYLDAIKNLFNMVDWSKKANLEKPYFLKHSREQFRDMLFQLEEAIAVEQSGFNDLTEAEKQLKYGAKEYDIYRMFEDMRDQVPLKNLKEFLTFRQQMADVFGLADKDNDKTLYSVVQELDEFWEIIELEIQMIQDEELKTEANLYYKNAKEQLITANYHQIQQFVWSAKLKFDFNVNRIRSQFYRKRVPCPTICFPCKFLRGILTKSRIRIKNPELIYFSSGKSLMILKAQVTHTLDLITDILLAAEMYKFSRIELKENSPWSNLTMGKGFFPDEQQTVHDYNICFMIIAIAIFGPYIIQYSSFMNSIHNKGFFTTQKFKKFGSAKRTFLSFSFTALGLLIMPLIDILLKIQAIINVLMIPFFCQVKKKNKSIARLVHEKMVQFFEQNFNLNSFELENFEKQKKYTQVLFEDTLMVSLQFLVNTGVLIVPEITNPKFEKKGVGAYALFLSLLTTCISICTTMFSIWTESKGLKESSMEYVMLSMKAKLDWVPYGNKLMHRQIGQDIDYSLIEFKTPLITDLVGAYSGFIYQFSEESLKKLLSQLDFAHSKRQNEVEQRNLDENGQEIPKDKEQILNEEIAKFIPRLKFGFSLFQMTIHSFCNFVDRNAIRDQEYVWNYLDFNDIDWMQMINNSIKQELDMVQPQTEAGKSLLQICIENENTKKGTWQLRDLMETLLNYEGLEPDVDDAQGQVTLLTYCYLQRKHRAFKMLIEFATDKIDVNRVNIKDDSTIYGQLFYNKNLDFFIKEGYKPTEKLAQLHNYFGEKIDRNKPQIFVEGSFLRCPIYHYLKHIRKGQGMKIDEMQQEQQYQDYFGDEILEIKNRLEIQQVLLLLFEPQTTKNLSISQLEVPFKKKGSFEQFFEEVNEHGDNFMHLVECRYAPPFWNQFIEGDAKQKASKLKSVTMELLTRPNKQKKTPVMKALDTHFPKFKAISKLFSLDLLNKEAFYGYEDEIIKLFAKYFIIQYSKQDQRNADLIDRHKFFSVFKDQDDAYKYTKDRFQVINQQHVFEHYLQIEEFEQKLAANLENNDEEIDQVFQALLYKNNYLDQKIQKFDRENDYRIIPSVFESLLVDKSVEASRQHFVVEMYLNGFIEISSILDFFSDCIVLYQLSQSTDTAWFSFSLFTMICPYYTVYSSLMTFKINDIRKMKEQEVQGMGIAKNLFMIMPTILLYMVLMDIAFMFLNLIMYPMMFIIMLFPFRKRVYVFYEEFWDVMFKKLFGMSIMDARGFKCQRTILQLHLESIPQIFFQVYLLFRIPQLQGQYGGNFKISVDIDTIKFSLLMAFLHVVFEMINLYFESETSETNFMDYMVACYSARQGWLPQRDKFFIQTDNQFDHFQNANDSQLFVLESNSGLDESQINIYRDTNSLIEFDNLDKEFWNCIGFSVGFEFSDNSMEYLIQLISDLPYLNHESQSKVIMFGGCIQHVQFTTILQLLHIAYKKIDILFDDDVLKQIISKDKAFLKMIQRPAEFHTSQEEEYHIVDMVKMNYTQVVKIMAELGADLSIKSKKKIEYHSKNVQDDQAGTLLFKIAFKYGNKDMLSLIMIYSIKRGYSTVQQSMKDGDTIQEEIRSGRDGKYLKQPLMFFDPKMLIPWDMKNTFIFNMKNYIQEFKEQAKQRWNVLFGAYVPFIDYKNSHELVAVIERVKEWVSEYPSHIKLCFGTDDEMKFCEIDSQFMCQFVLIRRAFSLQKCNDIYLNFQSVIDLTKLLQDEDINAKLEDVLNTYKIYHNQMFNPTMDQIRTCDRIIKYLGFDKEWGQYYYYSRKALADQINDDHFTIQQSNVSKTPKVQIDSNALAIKEFRVYKANSDDEAFYLKLKFEKPYYKGWFDTFVPSLEFWNNEEIRQDEQLALVIHHQLDNYSLVDDYKFRLMNLLVKHQLRGNDGISIELRDKNKNLIDSRFEVITYKSI